MSPGGARLTQGANVTLAQQVVGVRRVRVGLTWELDLVGGATPELDAQVILSGAPGEALDDAHLVFFSQLQAAPRGSEGAGDRAGQASHHGAGGGAVEEIVVDLDAVPPAVTRLVLVAAIYAAAPRRQSFAQVHRAAVEVTDAEGGGAIARYELADGTGAETAMVFGELYRHAQGWRFRAVGQGYAGGLAAVARDYGLRV